MSFTKKTWKDRQSEHPTRRVLNPTGTTNTYDVSRAEGLVMEDGDAFDASNMNDLENRVAEGINGTAALYTATLTLDGWEACSGTDLTNGYLYKQTATLTPDNSAAPAVTADSTFVSGVQFTPTGVAATDETLADVLNIINDGRTVSEAGNVTVYVTEKPTAEIHARWAITT